ASDGPDRASRRGAGAQTVNDGSLDIVHDDGGPRVRLLNLEGRVLDADVAGVADIEPMGGEGPHEAGFERGVDALGDIPRRVLTRAAAAGTHMDVGEADVLDRSAWNADHPADEIAPRARDVDVREPYATHARHLGAARCPIARRQPHEDRMVHRIAEDDVGKDHRSEESR